MAGDLIGYTLGWVRDLGLPGSRRVFLKMFLLDAGLRACRSSVSHR